MMPVRWSSRLIRPLQSHRALGHRRRLPWPHVLSRRGLVWVVGLGRLRSRSRLPAPGLVCRGAAIPLKRGGRRLSWWRREGEEAS